MDDTDFAIAVRLEVGWREVYTPRERGIVSKVGLEISSKGWDITG